MSMENLLLEHLRGEKSNQACPELTMDPIIAYKFAQVFHEITGLPDQDGLLLTPATLPGPSKEKEE